jgi:hypothetical protein
MAKLSSLGRHNKGQEGEGGGGKGEGGGGGRGE